MKKITLKFTFVDFIKTILILLIFYTIFEEFYIGPEIGNTLIWIIIYLIFMLFTSAKIYRTNFGKPILCLLVGIVIEIFLTSFVYGIDLINLAYTWRWFFYIVLYFIFYDFCKNQNNRRAFIVVFTTCSLVLACLILAQGYSRSYISPEWFLNESAQDVGTEWRNGRVRLNLSPGLRMISFVYSYTYVVTSKKKKNLFLHIANIVTTVLTFLFFDSTRMMILIVIAFIAITFWYGIHLSSKKITYFIKFAAILAVVIAALYIISSDSGSIVSYIQGLVISTNEGSWYARIGAYLYYLKKAFDPPIMGIGLLMDDISGAWNLVHGPLGIYYASDVGIIGTLATTGWIATFSYLFIVLKVSYKAFSNHKKGEWSLQEGIALLMISYLFTLSMLDGQRIYMIPLCLTLYTYYGNFND